MPGTVDPTQTETVEPDSVAPVDVAPATAQPAAQSVPSSKLLTIPTTRMKEIKEKERERGKKLALEELNAQAKQLGFKDFEAMKAAATRKNSAATSAKPAERKDAKDRSGSQPNPRNDQSAQAKTDNRQFSRLERENQRLLDERKRLNRLRAADQKARLSMQRKLDEREVETELKIAAIHAGVSGEYVDFALDRLRKETAGKTPKELETFNEAEFFAGLRDRMPFLFGVEARPVTTGPSSKEASTQAPTPPKPGAVKRDQADAGKIDAMKMTQQEFQQHLKERGLVRPNGSYTS